MNQTSSYGVRCFDDSPRRSSSALAALRTVCFGRTPHDPDARPTSDARAWEALASEEAHEPSGAARSGQRAPGAARSGCSERSPRGSLPMCTAAGATACRILAERPRDATNGVRHLPRKALRAGLAGAGATPIVESIACRPPRRFARSRAFHEQSPALGASTRHPLAEGSPRSRAPLHSPPWPPSPAARSSPAAAAPPTPSPIRVPLRRARPRPAPGERPKVGSASSPARR